MLTVTVSGLTSSGTGDQLSLAGAIDDGKTDKKKEIYRNIDFVTDEMKNRFGGDVISLASLTSKKEKPAIEMDYDDIE